MMRLRYGFRLGATMLLLAKEDVPLLVFMLGLYVFLFRRERTVGAVTAFLGAAWFLIATQVIQPHFHGLPTSPFSHRIMVFGPTIADSIQNVIREPALVWRWIVRPEIVTYLGGLLASAGFLSLFGPAVLILSAPVVAMNVFSTWSWTYSEGAHYTASVVPFVIVSAIHGLGWLAGQMSRLSIRPKWSINGLATLALLVAGWHHYQIGISPLARSYAPPRVTEHHLLARELMALIPPEAALSTQSGLYPHLAHRQKAYFFPAVNDAEYVLLDVTGPSFPITVQEVYETAERLLNSGEYGILAARDGLLLLKRGPSGGAETSLPGEFYTFVRAGDRAIAHPLHARFGDALELLGYDDTIYNAVHAHQLPVTVTTYWRALRPLQDGLQITLFFSREDGAIVYHYAGPTAAELWLPPSRWQEGEVIRIETPILSAGRLRDAMVAVTPPGRDLWLAQDRLAVDAGDAPAEVYDEGTLLRLFSFR